VLQIGGTIQLKGPSLQWVKKEKNGDVELTFYDSGHCETQLEFSEENFRRLGEAVSLFTFGKKDEIAFDACKGDVLAEGLQVMIDDQTVDFRVPEVGDEEIPTIVIQITSDKNDLNSGLGLTLNEAQAAELVKRLGMFLEAAKLRRDASKTKTIAAPARTKRTSAPASA
jgi:hypothetical protein